MRLLLINILLAFVWSALNGQFTLVNLTVGFVLGYIVLYLLREVFTGGEYFTKGAQLVKFVAFFLWELLVANLRVARDVLRPGPLQTRPRVIAVPVDLRGDLQVTLLANFIALTPGSLSLDISDDRKVMFIHFMHAPDPEATRQEIKNGFERKLVELFSQQGQPSERRKERKR